MEWRTETVRQICYAMRTTQDYSALPILADALEEAGYNNAYCNIDILRDASIGNIEKQRLVALIFSDDTRAAVENIEDMARDMHKGVPFVEHNSYQRFDGETVEYDYEYDSSMNYTKLMQGAADYLQGGDYITQYGSEDWRDVYGYSSDLMNKFWEWYELVTGVTIEDKDATFFSCSC